jgi:hypothetical protein
VSSKQAHQELVAIETIGDHDKSRCEKKHIDDSDQLLRLTITTPTPHVMAVVTNNPNSAVFSIILKCTSIHKNVEKTISWHINSSPTHHDKNTTVSLDTMT